MSTALILFGSMAVFLIIGVPIAFALGSLRVGYHCILARILR